MVRFPYSMFVVQQGLLSKASIRKMALTPKGGKDYGLGLFTNPRSDLHIIGHSGWVPGYTAQFPVECYGKYAVIFMRNYNVGSTDLADTAGKFLQEI